MNWSFLRWMTSHVPIYLIFWISLSVLVLAEDEDSDLELPTTTLRDGRCYPQDTCKFSRASRLSVSLDWKKRNCMCDKLCIQYGDCCLDSPHYADDQWRKAEQRFTCVKFSPYNSYWIINTCPISWTDEETRSLCEKNLNVDKLELERDFTSQLPVTSITNRVTYRNIHCARCNGETSSLDGSKRLRSWNLRLVCPTPLANFMTSPGSKFSRWDEERGWGLAIKLGNEETFYSCDAFFPKDLVPYIRPCQKSITRCAPSWTDPTVESKCRSYTSFVYRRDEAQIYHNVHCAQCNYVNRTELSCFNTNESTPRDLQPLNILFGFRDPCSDGQVYDTKSEKCRPVFCSEPRLFRDGLCVLQHDPIST